MNIYNGVILILAACGLFVFFRPKAKSSRAICAIMGAMGLMAAAAGGGGWGVQVVQSLLQAIVVLCCVLQLRRESVIRARRAARRKARAALLDAPHNEKPAHSARPARSA